MKNFDYKGSYINKTDHHIYIAPSEELKDIIAHYTITFPSEVPASSKLFHIIPDASGCFIFQGRSRRDFWCPMSEIVVLENDLQKAPARFFVEFRPGGLYQISGLHQKKLVNQRQQLRYLDVQLDEELALLYQSCKDYEQLIKAFNKYFTGKRKVNLLPARLIRAKEIIDQDHGNVSLEKVASDCHLSSRQLLRDFHNYIGLSGKEYAKVVRFNYLLKQIE